MISSELLTDLLYPEGDSLMGPQAHGRLQALLDVVPVALLEFRLEEDHLYLWAANAAARRMPGLGAVREEGVVAEVVFDLLAGTSLVDQLCAVARLGVPLDCRQVVREGTRVQLAWDLSARRVADHCIVVSVRDASEAENLRVALASAEAALTMPAVICTSRPKSSTPWKAWRTQGTGAASRTRARRCYCGPRPV